MYFFEIHASVVKLADALDSGSSGSDPMQVQVLSLAPRINRDIDTMRIGIAVYFFIF